MLLSFAVLIISNTSLYHALLLQNRQQIGGVRGVRGFEALFEAVEAIVDLRFVAAEEGGDGCGGEAGGREHI